MKWNGKLSKPSMALNPVMTMNCNCHKCAATKGMVFTVAAPLPLQDDLDLPSLDHPRACPRLLQIANLCI
nr:hypothetical protein CFP56_44206 [Quercus suber]